MSSILRWLCPRINVLKDVAADAENNSAVQSQDVTSDGEVANSQLWTSLHQLHSHVSSSFRVSSRCSRTPKTCEMKWNPEIAHSCVHWPVCIALVMDWRLAWINVEADYKINNWQVEMGVFVPRSRLTASARCAPLSFFQLAARLPIAWFRLLASSQFPLPHLYRFLLELDI